MSTQKEEKVVRTITVKDVLLMPYEIDVDNRNYTVVEVKITEAGTFAGEFREGGKRVRSVVGYYSTLGGAISCIVDAKKNNYLDSLEGSVVTLKKLLQAMDAYRDEIRKFMKRLDFRPDPSELLISPKDFLKGSLGDIVAGEADEDE